MQFVQEMNKTRLMNLFFVLLAAASLTFVAACKEKTTEEKIESAVEEIGDGFEDAADEFDDRSPVEKTGDAIEDFGDDVQDSFD